jgi:hypothetical protein
VYCSAEDLLELVTCITRERGDPNVACLEGVMILMGYARALDDEGAFDPSHG